MNCKDWKQVKLGDVCTISSSKRIFAKEYKNVGIPFYRGKEIIEKSKGNNISTELFISEDKYNQLKVKFGVPCAGDILLTSVGTLGIPYIVRNQKFYFKDGNVTWLKDFKQATSKFIYYWILSPVGKYQIDCKCIGSTQKALTIETLRNFNLLLPPLTEQKAISSILSALDDKIELNNKINKNLEEMAQAIFKSWFVDFEPFQDGEFVESELGLIPKGWKVGTLGELVTIKYGKDHKKLNDGNIPVYGSGGIMRYVDRPLFTYESVLIPRKGTLNNVIYVNEPFWSVDTMFYTKMNQKNIAKFIYFFVKSRDLLSMNSGSAVPSMTSKILNSLLLCVPPNNVLNDYENIVAHIFLLNQKNIKENEKLAQLRDTLLPKLMSGEIRVPLEVE